MKFSAPRIAEGVIVGLIVSALAALALYTYRRLRA
jgi:hypothetical protein